MRRLTITICLFVAAAAHAQAPTSFREGVMAFEKKEWAKAEALMRDAVAGNPNETEGTVRIAGEWYETYVPHYFLARALARQGKCAEALVHFAESERQGVTRTIADFARHLDARGGCKPSAKKSGSGRVVGEVTVPFAEESLPPPLPTPTPTPVSKLVVAPKPPPDPRNETRARLAVAVAAYLRGEYESTARMLKETRFKDRGAAAEAALFRAAARHALYRIDGKQDAALREQIERDLREYRRLRPNGKPDPRVFAPGFIALVK